MDCLSPRFSEWSSNRGIYRNLIWKPDLEVILDCDIRLANINSVPLPCFSLNLGDQTLVAQHDASETKLEAGGPICEVDPLIAVPTAVRSLRYCFLRQSACRAAWFGRESSKEPNMVLVYLYNSNTRTFKKGRPFFKRSWNKPPLPDM